MTGLKSMQAWRSHNRCPSLFEGQGYFYFGWYFLPSETDSQSEATLNWCFTQQAYAGRDVTSLDGHFVRRPGRYSQFSGPTAMTIMRERLARTPRQPRLVCAELATQHHASNELRQHYATRASAGICYKVNVIGKLIVTINSLQGKLLKLVGAQCIANALWTKAITLTWMPSKLFDQENNILKNLVLCNYI